MKSLTLWSASAVALSLATGSAFSAPAKPAAKPAPAAQKVSLPPGVVATVNGIPITKAEIDDRLWRENGSQLADRYVNQQIVEMEAKKRGITATPKEIADRVTTFRTQYMQQPGRQPKDWDDFLSRYGKANIDADMKIQVLAGKIGEDEAKNAKLTADEEKTTVDGLDRDAHQVHAKHILVGVGEQFGGRTDAAAQARIKEAQDKLAGGAKWDDVAKEYSDDVSNKDRGGDLGFFTRNRMVKEFEDAAFALKPGETTPQPVKTAYGYHIIQVIERKDNPPTDDAKKKALADRLDQKKTQAKDPRSWFPGVRDHYKVVQKMPYEK